MKNCTRYRFYLIIVRKREGIDAVKWRILKVPRLTEKLEGNRYSINILVTQFLFQNTISIDRLLGFLQLI